MNTGIMTRDFSEEYYQRLDQMHPVAVVAMTIILISIAIVVIVIWKEGNHMKDMTIYDVANRLQECAEGKCEGCAYRYNKFGEKRNYADCQADLISEMARLCKMISERLGNEG